MRKPLGRKGILLFVVMALVGLYAFSLMTDYDREFEEKELPEITYDVVAEKAESLLGMVADDPSYGLTEKALVLGQELNAYVAKNGGFYPVETFKYYPVFQEDYVAGTLTARVMSDGNIGLEYSTILVEETSECYLQEKAYCFVVDAKSIWLVTEDEARQVFVDSVKEKGRDLVDETIKDDPRLELKYVTKGELR